MDATQMAYLGIIVSVLVSLLRVLSARFGWKPNRTTVTILSFVVAVVMAAWTDWPEIAASTDPIAMAQSLLAAAGSIFGSAVLWYKILVERIAKKLNLED